MQWLISGVNMHLDLWARKYNISPMALAELKQLFFMETLPASSKAKATSEQAVSNAVRLEAAQKGTILWRNNVGCAIDQRGNNVRYGLCNDSKRLNTSVKSSDLIGIKPVLITPEMVGSTIGQFIAREVKKSQWVYKGTDREKAQYKFLEIVTGKGGDAKFCNGVGSI